MGAAYQWAIAVGGRNSCSAIFSEYGGFEFADAFLIEIRITSAWII